MELHIGIKKELREEIAQSLCRVLAETYSLYLKTHNFHWNVTGPMFASLHLEFEKHYTEMAMAVDVIAERIRSLGVYAPGSYKAFAQLSGIEDASDTVPEALEMVKILVKDHETLIKTARDVCSLAEEANDQSTLDLLTQRLQWHEKTAWMLRSFLEK